MKDKEKVYISDLFKARFPFLYIASWEENRVIDALMEISQNAEYIKTLRTIYVWSQTNGFIKYSNMELISDTENPLNALNYIENNDKEAAIYVLKDFNVFFGVKGNNPDYVIIRKCRDLVESLKAKNHPQNIVILAPSISLPESLQKDIVVYEYKLPDFNDIQDLLSDMIEANESNGNLVIDISEEEKKQLCRAALGLTYQEAENAFARAIVHDKRLDIHSIDIIHEEKCQVIRKTEILEYINANIQLADVGGLDNLKKWLTKRNESWTERAKEYCIPAPKGILITGVPGCGKSLCAKAMSAVWGLPLLKLDMGKIFSGLVGSSEENMRKAISTAEAVSPCILWIDEIEKGISGTKSSGDSGTSARVFGTFLTWMQEKEKPVFVVATSNDISMLPGEILRKGRFDEIFFVDLPTDAERKDIFRLHLEKRLKSSKASEDIAVNDELLEALSNKTEGFSGAEIEQIVIDGLFEAFSYDRSLNMEDLKKAISNTIPLSVTQAEQIISIRTWASTRAVAASSIESLGKYEDYKDESIVDKQKSAFSQIGKARGGRFVDF